VEPDGVEDNGPVAVVPTGSGGTGSETGRGSVVGARSDEGAGVTESVGADGTEPTRSGAGAGWETVVVLGRVSEDEGTTVVTWDPPSGAALVESVREGELVESVRDGELVESVRDRELVESVRDREPAACADAVRAAQTSAVASAAKRTIACRERNRRPCAIRRPPLPWPSPPWAAIHQWGYLTQKACAVKPDDSAATPEVRRSD
jgi:hypothetical protein